MLVSGKPRDSGVTEDDLGVLRGPFPGNSLTPQPEPAAHHGVNAAEHEGHTRPPAGLRWTGASARPRMQ